MLAVLTGLGLSAAAGLNAYIPFLVVALIDSVNDAIQTVVRPASAGIIVAATSAADDFEQSSSFIQENAWVGVLLGVAVALFVHSGKAAAP